MGLFTDLKIVLYFILTIIVLTISLFPVAFVFYWVITTGELIHYLLGSLYLLVAYFISTVFFGIVHSQFVVRPLLPFTIQPGSYSHFSSEGRLVGVRLTADSIFKSMLKVFTFLPFIWGMILFPKLMRLYGLKIGKNVHVATRTYIESAGLVEIGDNSFIGYNSSISGHAHENRAIVINPVKIGKNVTVGAYSIMGPGSAIGDRGVLGAYSGLLKNQKIPENEVWGGAPAKLIKKREPKKSSKSEKDA